MNELALHPQKTKCIVHGSNMPLRVTLGGIEVREVDGERLRSACLRGVEIEKNLKWHAQASNVADKIKKALYCFSRSKNVLCKSARLNFFNSFILSQVSYCLPIWGRAALTDPTLNKLFKKSIRYVSNQRNKIHTSPMCKVLNILPLADTYRQSVRCFAYKCFHQERLSNLQCQRGRAGASSKFVTPFCHGQRQATNDLALEWNNLPQDLKELINKPFHLFKQLSKKSLLTTIPDLFCTNPGCIECCTPEG